MKKCYIAKKRPKSEDILFNNKYPDDRSKGFIYIIIILFILINIKQQIKDNFLIEIKQ